ncbi:MAG: hypothetical protein LV480_14810 [Methylacidiphilales bacterium]|nr:hypothetical protein [Candidatus Methylacidiphilales bacterium]
MIKAIEKEYTVHLDTKNRFTLRGAKTKFYRVKVLRDGHLILFPQKLVPSSRLSKDTLRQITQSVRNLKNGKVGSPIDIAAARKLLRG